MPATNFTPIQLYRSTTASQVPTSGNLSDGELAINTNDEKLYFKNSGGTVKLLASSAGASGDVVGPASATDNAVVRFDGTTGKLVQNSVVTIADSTGDVAGVGALTMGGNLTLSGGTANGVLYLNGSKVATSGSALTFDGAILGVNGVSVGRGAGAVSTNTAVGASALAANTTGGSNTALGLQALLSNTTASNNTAVGYQALYSTTTVGNNTALGFQAGYSQTTANNIGSNTYIGYQAGYATTSEQNLMAGSLAGFANSTGKNHVLVGFKAGFNNTTGSNNTFVGNSAGQNVTTGSSNTFIGSGVLNVQDGSGSAMTTGSKNTILGNFTGNQGGLDIRTASNNIVLSDGDGNPRLYFYANQWYLPSRMFVTSAAYFTSASGTGLRFNNEADTQNNVIMYNNGTTWHRNAISVGGATPATSGVGVTFPATQSASSDANTLDDYEEGTWTPGISFGGASAGVTYDGGNTAGTYTKVGRAVFYRCTIVLTDKGTSTGQFRITGLPVACASNGWSASAIGNFLNVTYAQDINAYVEASATTIVFWNSGPARSTFTDSGVTNSSQFMAAGVYFI